MLPRANNVILPLDELQDSAILVCKSSSTEIDRTPSRFLSARVPARRDQRALLPGAISAPVPTAAADFRENAQGST